MVCSLVHFLLSLETLSLYSLFEHCPGARPCFGFYVDAKADSSELLQNARFQAQAKYITEMLDTALDLLGPDVELLSKSMLELGAKSAQHGVKPEMSPFLRKALGYTLRKNLGKEQFTDAVKRSWQETYDALSEEVIKGQANA